MSVHRGCQREPSSAIAGAPITIPIAKALVAAAALPGETPNSSEIGSSRPASMNSLAPWAKIARART